MGELLGGLLDGKLGAILSQRCHSESCLWLLHAGFFPEASTPTKPSSCSLDGLPPNITTPGWPEERLDEALTVYRWNYFAWIFDSVSMPAIIANQITSMWGLLHPDYTSQRWHVFATSWMCCTTVLFANRAFRLSVISDYSLSLQALLLLFGFAPSCFNSFRMARLAESNWIQGDCRRHVWREWVGIKGSLPKRRYGEFRCNLSNGLKPVDNSNIIHAANEEFQELAYDTGFIYLPLGISFQRLIYKRAE